MKQKKSKVWTPDDEEKLIIININKISEKINE